jgi:hypothetical protein
MVRWRKSFRIDAASPTWLSVDGRREEGTGRHGPIFAVVSSARFST